MYYIWGARLREPTATGRPASQFQIAGGGAISQVGRAAAARFPRRAKGETAREEGSMGPPAGRPPWGVSIQQAGHLETEPNRNRFFLPDTGGPRVGGGAVKRAYGWTPGPLGACLRIRAPLGRGWSLTQNGLKADSKMMQR